MQYWAAHFDLSQTALGHLRPKAPGLQLTGKKAEKQAADLAENENNSLFVSIWRSSTDGGEAFFS